MNNSVSSTLRWILLGLTAALTVRADDQRFTTSSTLQTEAQLLIRVLSEYNYNHAAVHQADFGEVIPDYMETLDNQHMFFLATDQAKFTAKYNANTVYANLAYLGNLDPAYEIYYVYRRRVTDRVQWILNQLNRPVDLNGHDSFAYDRTKAEWPATAADADELWSKRLKWEMLADLLSEKPAPTAKTTAAATAPAPAAHPLPDAPLAEVKDKVRKRYESLLKSLAQTDAEDLAETYLTTVTGLYDPHSAYMSAENFADFGIQMKLQLVGIGAVLQLKDEYCIVRELVPGGPADLGHQLKQNDKIVAVAQDGKEPVDIIGMKLRNVVKMIRGEKGTKVRLTVEPAGGIGAGAKKDILIVRDLVKLDSARARGAVFQAPDGRGGTVPMGVITLPEFYADDPAQGGVQRSASADVAQLIGQMKSANIQGLVLDLRQNGGGFLGEAINLAGLFLPHGPVVQVRDNQGITVDNDDQSQIAYTGPLAVLVDRFSASASEIVTGALQNYGRAIIIGDASTHGKGTVQTVVEMKNISPTLAYSSDPTDAAKITIQKFYLPNGSSTQLDGVRSDIALPSIDDYLPLGESSLKHALIWDRIDSAYFEGHPLSPKVLDALKQASLARQAKLEEFAYLRRVVDWFKARQEDDKHVSLNLEDRRKERAIDEAFKKEMDAERDRLARQDYPYKVYRLGAPPPPRAAPSDDDGDESDVTELSTDELHPYKADIDLREALRVLNDAINLGHNHDYWASDHAPLTVAAE